MKGKKRKKRQSPSGTPAKVDDKKRLPWKKVLLLALSFAVIFGFYQVGIYFCWEWIVHLYCIAAGVLAVAYVIINRGIFTLPERDSLPDGWDEERKDIFIEDQKKRRRISSVLLYIAIPVIMTIVIDMMYIHLSVNMGIDLW